MSTLVDTNILLRIVQQNHPHHAVALNGLERLLAETQVYFTLQNIAEFWNAATRPIENNGLGYSIPFTLGEVEKIEALLTFLAGHAFGLCRMEADCCRAWRFG